jgi:hypothetical protein
MLMALTDARYLERIRFFDRQRLLAPDLQTLESFNRQMRWLHNRSLHQPGIGSGYAVSGKKGDREIVVTPGYAIDAEGREIILTSRHTEPVPPVSGGGDGKPAVYDLAVSYPSDADLKETETREGACQSHGAVRRREEPVFCWVRLNDNGTAAENEILKQRIRDGMLIVLAEAQVANCQLKQDVSATQRRNARPPKQPRIACGVASPPKWDPLNGEGFNAWKADIDTTSGSFGSIPSYTARVRADDEVWQGKLLMAAVDIVNARSTGFTIRLFASTWANGNSPPDFIQVVWMGVEA